MRRLQKLIRNGNSTMVTLSPQVLAWLGWVPGQLIVVELTDSKRVVIRAPVDGEFLPQQTMAITLGATMPSVK